MERFKLNLQLFTEGTEVSASGTESTTTNGTEQTSNSGTEGNTSDNSGDTGNADNQPKYTDEDVNRLIDKKFAEWQKKQQKAVDEAKKLAEMNATQKAEYERDQLKKELEEYKLKDSLAEMSKTARKMLNDGGINVSDELLSMLVTNDAEGTKAAVEGFSKLFTEAVENAVKDRLRGETPKTGTGTNTTISEIDKRIKKYE